MSKIRLGKAERLLVRQYHQAKAQAKAIVVKANLAEGKPRNPLKGVRSDGMSQSLGMRFTTAYSGVHARFSDPQNIPRPIRPGAKIIGTRK